MSAMQDPSLGQAVSQTMPQAASSASPQDYLNAPPTPEELALTAPPTADELKAVGYNPPPIVTQTPEHTPDVIQTLKDMGTAVVGEAGSLGAGLLANVGKIIGNNPVGKALQSLQGSQDFWDQKVDEAKQSSPIAAGAAKIGTDLVGALLGGEVGAGVKAASGATGILGSLASGAAQGGLASLATDKGEDAGKDALIGAAGGGALVGLGGVIGSGLNKLNLGSIVGKSPDALADKLVGNMVSKMSPGQAANISPEDILTQMKATLNNVAETKNGLYAARDALAANAGINVSRSALANTVKQISESTADLTNPQIKSALSIAQDTLGSGNDIPFATAQQGLSGLKSAATEAAANGSGQKAMLLGQMADALDKDIELSAGAHPEVMAAHDAATDFARNTFYPLANANLEKIALDKASELKFVNGLMKQGLNTTVNSPTSAMMTQDPDFAMKVLSAHINALKDAATPDGENINLTKFANSLNKSAQNMPQAFGDYLQPVRTLATVLQAAKKTAGSTSMSAGGAALFGGITGFQHGGVEGAAKGAVGGAIAGAMIPKAAMLYGAGKMLQSPDALQMLKNAGMLENSNNAGMKALVNNKVTQLFGNMALKVAPSAAVGAGMSQLNTPTN